MLEPNLEEECVLAGYAGPDGRVIQAERRACAKVQSPQCPHLSAPRFHPVRKKDRVGPVVAQILLVLRISDPRNEYIHPG